MYTLSLSSFGVAGFASCKVLLAQLALKVFKVILVQPGPLDLQAHRVFKVLLVLQVHRASKVSKAFRAMLGQQVQLVALEPLAQQVQLVQPGPLAQQVHLSAI